MRKLFFLMALHQEFKGQYRFPDRYVYHSHRQYLIVQFGGEVFRTVPLSWKDWGIIVGLTSLVLWIGEILRLMKKQ